MFCCIKLRRPVDLPRALKEVEAESVAYVVASVHGMPTDDYSFPYVAGWAGEDADKAIRGTQARVNVAAQAIIAAVAGRAHGGCQAAGHRPGNGAQCADSKERRQTARVDSLGRQERSNGVTIARRIGRGVMAQGPEPVSYPSRPIWLSTPWPEASGSSVSSGSAGPCRPFLSVTG